MITLFIDTHSKMLNVGLKINDKTYEIKEESNMEHSSKTLNKIKELLDNCNLKPNDIDKIIVVVGPGSYTGLRIGVTIAKTMAYTLNKKITMASSLKVKVLGRKYDNECAVLLDAKRDHYFAAIYDKEYNEVLKETYIHKDELSLDNKEVLYDDVDLNINSIIDYYIDKEETNPHLVIPNYLKDVYIEKK